MQSQLHEVNKTLLSNKVNSIEKQTVDFRRAIKEHAKAHKKMQDSITKINQSISNVDEFKDHAELHSSLVELKSIIPQLITQESLFYKRGAKTIPDDIENFIKTWRPVKELALNFCEATTKHRIAKTLKAMTQASAPLPHSGEDVAKEFKEKKMIDTKITIALGDLFNTLEDYVHSQLFFLAKSLEAWNQVWQKIHQNKPSQEDKEEQGEIQREVDKLEEEVLDDSGQEEEEDDEEPEPKDTKRTSFKKKSMSMRQNK